MRLNIEVIEDEGMMYDIERAKDEGLFEEMRLWTVTGTYNDPMSTVVHERRLNEDEMRKLLDVLFDIGANLETGEVVTLNMVLKYRYDYGHAEIVPESLSA